MCFQDAKNDHQGRRSLRRRADRDTCTKSQRGKMGLNVSANVLWGTLRAVRRRTNWVKCKLQGLRKEGSRVLCLLCVISTLGGNFIAQKSEETVQMVSHSGCGEGLGATHRPHTFTLACHIGKERLACDVAMAMVGLRFVTQSTHSPHDYVEMIP